MQLHDSPFANMVWFMGVVENINDPMMAHRVQVRCIGFHTEDLSASPLSNLPWATFLTAGADTNVPMVKPGDWVAGFFLDNTEAQQPVILGKLHGVTPQTAADKTKGFADPAGTFPRFANTVTTSELARGVANTVVAYKANTIAKGVVTADGGSWDEPATLYKAVYPDNYVIQTDAYNVIELDDTSGAERVAVFHHHGSFFEFHPTGDVVQRTLGGHFLLAYKNFRIFVAGDASISATGNVAFAAGGSMTLSATKSLNLVAADVVIDATNSITTGSATLTLGATGALTIAGASLTAGASGAVKINGGTLDLGASGAVTLGGASADIGASGSVTVGGSSVALGGSGPSGGGGQAGQAGTLKIATVPVLTCNAYVLPYSSNTANT